MLAAIVPNYNQDWSRYTSDPNTTKYDKYNYSTKYSRSTL